MGSVVREGMKVRTADGEALGTVVRCDTDTFTTERGLVFAREFVASYDDVADIRGSEVRLRRRLAELRPPAEAPERAEEDGEQRLALGRFGESQDVRLELAAEQAIPTTHVTEAGEVRIHKVVRTEVRTFRIPIRREEIHVERVARGAEGTPPAHSLVAAVRSATPFEETSFVIPLYEERVEFTKQPHVWQEVHVTRVALEELARVKTTVRREVAEVEGNAEEVLVGPALTSTPH